MAERDSWFMQRFSLTSLSGMTTLNLNRGAELKAVGNLLPSTNSPTPHLFPYLFGPLGYENLETLLDKPAGFTS
jgi:hypothetical protein